MKRPGLGIRFWALIFAIHVVYFCVGCLIGAALS